jgi:GH25 family lysozyme M1 (1,4-beta-N-acetylmuramidase)
MIQARLVDIHRYYRTGGVDWQKLKANFDAVIISAGVGLAPNPLLREQVDGAIAHDLPYATYFIPSPNYSMYVQTDHYLGLYGVRNACTFVDIEPPSKGIRCINDIESLACLHRIEDKTGKRPLIYSNPQYINEAIHRPIWLPDYWLWIAQWVYEIWPIKLYWYFESFLKRNANTYPPYVRKTAYQPKTILWQFTCKGNAQALCASARTNDPIYQYGVKDADLNVSTIDKAAFLSLLGVIGPSPEPPPEPEGDWYRIPVAERNIRKTPNAVIGAVAAMLRLNDQVMISEIVSGVPGQWGKTIAYKRNNIIIPLPGYYVYMGSLLKV